MRKLGIAVLAFVMILIGVGFVVASRIDTYLNENRDWIASQAEDALGRTVSFGELGVSFSNGVGASISDLRVGEDPSYGDGDFAALDQVVVRIKIWPALFGRYEVSSVMLRRPRISIIQSASGMNTDSLGGSASDEAASPSAGSSPEATSPQSASVFAIALLDIEDGHVRYVDRSTSESVEFEIARLNVRASDLSTDRPVAFELSASVLGSERANVEGEGRVGPVAGSEEIPIDVTISLSDIPIEGLMALPQLAGVLSEGQRASGPIRFNATARGNPKQLAFEMKLDAKDAIFDLPETLNKPAGTPLSYQATGRYTGETVELESGSLVFDRATIATQGRVSLGEATRYEINLTSRDMPLGGWDALLPAVVGLGIDGRAGLDVGIKGNTASEATPSLSGSVTLSNVAVRVPDQPEVTELTSKIQLTDGGVVVPEFNFELGGSPCTASARIPNLEKPSVAFTFTSPMLRGESIGLSEAGAEKPDVLRALQIVGTATPAPDGAIVDAQVTSGGGTIAGVAFEELKGHLKADSNLATVDEMVVKAFGGSATARATYDLTETETPGWTLNLGLAGIQATQLAASQLGFASDMFDGKINSNFSLNGRGFTKEALASALTGQGNIDVVEGMLKNVNLGELVLNKVTGISGLSNLLSSDVRSKHKKLFTEGTTAFRALRSNFAVRDGRVHADNLKIDAFDYGLSGAGSIGLDGDVVLTALFKTSPELTNSLTGSVKAVKYLADKDGRIEIPLKLGGSLDGISVKPDLKFAETAMARAASGALQDQATKLIGNSLLGKKKKSSKDPKPASQSGSTDTEASQAK